MPHSNPTLIDSLRTTADRLEAGAHYEWGHMGRCNCGQLVQTLTQLTDQQIVEAADFQLAEWSEHAQEYCRGAGHKVDSLFLTLQQVGFDYWDVIHLENLSDRRVLARLGERRYLRRNCRDDAVLYMRTMADLLETV
jgi:hypothetical protein